MGNRYRPDIIYIIKMNYTCRHNKSSYVSLIYNQYIDTIISIININIHILNMGNVYYILVPMEIHLSGDEQIIYEWDLNFLSYLPHNLT